MPEQNSTTRTMKISAVKETLSRLVNEVSGARTRVLIEKSGSPVAALVSVHDLERLQELDLAREEHFQAIE